MPRKSKAFSDRQMEGIARSTATWNLWAGSVRSGKTHGSFGWWADFVGRYAPDGPLVLVAKTERTLYRNLIEPMRAIFGGVRFSYSRGRSEGVFLGRPFYGVGANDERAAEKIQGSTFAGCLGDEGSLWPESFFQMLRSRLSLAGARALITTNPDGPWHFLKRELIDRQGESGLDIHTETFLLSDNPYVDQAFVRRISSEYTGLWYKRYILGEWCQAEGAVYDGWDPDRHVVAHHPEGAADAVYLGVDYGTANPTVFLPVEVRGDSVHVPREYYWDSRVEGHQKTDREYREDLVAFDPSGHGVVLDPSAASFAAELRSSGVVVDDADNAVLDGIRDVATLLGQGRLTVHESCENLIREFTSYRWDQRAQQRGEDKPMKEYDHCLDALRYVVRTKVTTGSALSWLRAFED